VDPYDLKAVLEATMELAWGPDARVLPGDVTGFPGVAGRMLQVVGVDGRVLGGGGTVDPRTLDVPPWAGEVLAFEFALPDAPAAPAGVLARALPAFPASERDLALLVPVEVPVARVDELAREAAGRQLEAVEIFDLYQGEGIPDGTRSVAFRFRFRSSERTLTDDEVERATRRVTDRLAEELGVHVRG
jgi:phenylalanyl-tRNA synthetase beta chain